MPLETFNFCPNSLVPVTMPRDPQQVLSMNGWSFSAKPTTPFQRRFRVTLHGLRWYTNNTTGLYDSTTNPTINARALELFYERHETWKTFTWVHPHLGSLTCRFGASLTVPEGLPNANGLIGPLEITIIHNDPGFS